MSLILPKVNTKPQTTTDTGSSLKELMIKTSFLKKKTANRDAYLQPSRTSSRELFCDNSQRLLAKKNSIKDFRLGSRYAFGLSYGNKTGRYEFTQCRVSTP